MHEPRMICLGGPSGAGKDTIATAFLSRHANYIRVPRSTTRAPRKDEVEGLHYRFLNEMEFRQKVLLGDIIAVDVFCENLYGIDISHISKALRSGENIIGVFGICSVDLRKRFQEKTVLVYVGAPLTFLEERLRKRGDPPKNIRMRIAAAEEQMLKEPELFDHVVWNVSDRETTLQEFERILGLA